MSICRVVYFGTPDYAVPALERLESDPRFDVALVVTQPDRPAGRGHRLLPPPVKQASIALGLPVYQPESLRSVEAREPLLSADADLFVVAAFGLIFGEKTLGIPRYGAINLHASLLPAYRGASPIAAAISEGEERTGVTLMVMERGLDSGPIIAERSLEISDADTTASLTARLAALGADLLIDEIGGYLDGSTTPRPQPLDGVSLARPMRKSDGEIDWTRTSTGIDRHVRAMWPWPRAWSRVRDQLVQVHAVERMETNLNTEPGRVRLERGVLVGCGEGAIELKTIQFPGKPPIDASAAARGGLFRDGDQFAPLPAERQPLVERLSSGSSTNV